MDIAFAEPSIPASGTLVVGILPERTLTPAAEELDRATGGAIGRALAAGGKFTGKRDEMLPLVAPPGTDLSRVVLIGLGKPEELSALALQKLGGQLVPLLNQHGERAAAVRLDGLDGLPVDPLTAATAVGEGALLRAYRFDKYRTKEKPEAKPTLEAVTVMIEGAADAAAVFADRRKVADGVFFGRDLASEPANVLYPESFADLCKPLSELGVDVEILDEKKLRKLGMNALLAVGQGSARESRLVVMEWRGDPKAEDKAPLVFVGKGVTFDTGGISLKPAAGMEDMKWDMGGGAAVAGLMKALAGRKAKVNAVGLIGLVENMPSGTAQRPGDIVTSLSGQTVEVINTDAEGRLVLADVLWYAEDRFKPRLMIDLATLTGAVIVALGHETAGLFTPDDALAERLTAAGQAVGEKVWRLPMEEAYDKELETPAADMKNVAANRWAGSAVAAMFLKRFVREVPWAHLDIAGMAWATKDLPVVPKGGTGFGVRLLDRLVADHYEAR
jgi:leucyl aminopeptidase